MHFVKGIYNMNYLHKIEQMNFPQFLELKFLEWQKQQGGRKTVKEFAAYLGVSQSTISTWWNEDRRPEGENLVRLANKLGLEVYDALGKPRPDIDFHYIQSNWEDLTPDQRLALREQAANYAAQNQTKAENERRRKPKTA